MRRSLFAAGVIAVLIAALALGGCAGTTVLLHPSPPPLPRSYTGRLYLDQLGAAQSRLAAAEQAIPHSPHTPGQLAHSITLLASAMHGLTGGLSVIKPPGAVARLHRRLIAIATVYERRLHLLAAQARVPQDEVAAANAMANATEVASTSFTATSATIRKRLAR